MGALLAAPSLQCLGGMSLDTCGRSICPGLQYHHLMVCHPSTTAPLLAPPGAPGDSNRQKLPPSPTLQSAAVVPLVLVLLVLVLLVLVLLVLVLLVLVLLVLVLLIHLWGSTATVSYTNLTLPTKRIV